MLIDVPCNRVKLKHFSKFGDMTEALAAATAAIEGKMSKGLKKVLKKVFASDAHEQLAVADAKLGSVIKVTAEFRNRIEVWVATRSAQSQTALIGQLTQLVGQ